MKERCLIVCLGLLALIQAGMLHLHIQNPSRFAWSILLIIRQIYTSGDYWNERNVASGKQF